MGTPKFSDVPERVDKKLQRLNVEEAEGYIGRVFLAYGTRMTSVSSFHYLGRMFLSANDDWSAVEQNLQMVRGNGDDWKISCEGRELIIEQRDVLCGRGENSDHVWFQDRGYDPPVGEIPQGVSPPGGATDGRYVTQTSEGWDVGISNH